MEPDNPDPPPTRTYPPAEAADLTRTFAAGSVATPNDPLTVSLPAPLAGPIPGWPANLTRYQPLHPLGEGGMGAVYLAHDRQLDRPVAIKFARGVGTTTVDRILLEARSAARLHHPNICPVFDADVCDGVPYLTMAFVDGPTLAAELKRCGPCPPVPAAKLVRTVAEAMQYAHDHGVIHRDLKPGNVLLTAEREPIVSDFGLAVRLDRDPAATGSISGTPHYMAPEQAAGDTARVGERTDVFALGVILYELLTGRTPFDGSARQVLERVQREPVPPVRKVRRDVSPELDRIVAKATARDPDDRFATMAEFADALTGYLRTTKPVLGKRRSWVFFLVAIPAGVIFGGVLLFCGLAFLLPAIQKMRTTSGKSRVTVTARGLPVTTDEAKRARVAWVDGEEFAGRGKYDEAMAKFDEAVQLDPSADRPRELRAELYTRLGRYEDALAEYNVLLRRWKSDSKDWQFRRAEILIRLRQYSDALLDLNQLVEKRPSDAGALVARGAARLGLNEFEQAKIDLTRAVLSDPNHAEAKYLRGMARRRLGDERGAAEDVDAARSRDAEVESKLRLRGYLNFTPRN